MKSFLRFLIAVSLASAPASSLAAKEKTNDTEAKPLSIVAVVNDEVVTSIDVTDRARFIMTTGKLPQSPETMARLIPQVTRQMIDETLQLQEAKRLDITISDAQVSKAIEGLAASRGGTSDLLFSQLAAAGIPGETFKSQIRAQLAWQKVVGKTLRSKVKISQEEVELARLQESTALQAGGKGEVQIITLTIPVEKPEQESQVKGFAEKLVNDLRAGASFEEVTSQLSAGQSPEPVWVSLAALDPTLASALENAAPGAVSNPARSTDGYLIVKLLNRRGLASVAVNDSELLIKDILLKLKEDDSADDATVSLDIAREVARYPGNCKSPEVANVKGAEDASIETSFLQARFSELSPVMQDMVSNLSVGGVTEPFATPDGIRLLMLCERVDAPPVLADAEEIYARLMNKKLEMETQKYMRNLRREAFIELREL